MKLALIRHGITVGNLYGAYVGKQDQPICSEGKQELEKLRINAAYPVVDAVFTSPMLRCTQTAKTIYPEQEAISIDLLAERDFGKFDGLTHKEITGIPGYADWGSTPERMEFPGGEDWEPFSRRAADGLEKVIKHGIHRGYASCAVVCHGGVIMALMEQLVTPKKSWYEWQCRPGRGYYIKILSSRDAAILIRRLAP